MPLVVVAITLGGLDIPREWAVAAGLTDGLPTSMSKWLDGATRMNAGLPGNPALY